MMAVVQWPALLSILAQVFQLLPECFGPTAGDTQAGWSARSRETEQQVTRCRRCLFFDTQDMGCAASSKQEVTKVGIQTLAPRVLKDGVCLADGRFT